MLERDDMVATTQVDENMASAAKHKQNLVHVSEASCSALAISLIEDEGLRQGDCQLVSGLRQMTSKVKTMVSLAAILCISVELVIWVCVCCLS